MFIHFDHTFHIIQFCPHYGAHKFVIQVPEAKFEIESIIFFTCMDIKLCREGILGILSAKEENLMLYFLLQ